MNPASLMYHDVVPRGAWDASGFPGPAAALYKLDEEEFSRHLVSLDAIGRAVSVWDALRARDTPTFLLTFDDGGVSACRVGEWLLARGWVGHFFVTTDRIGTDGFLSCGQIQQLRAAGHVIGSHSCSHPSRMAACERGELVREWTHSLAVLARILGDPVRVASVPGGYYSAAVAQAASEAGVQVLFTSEPTVRRFSVGNCLVIGRYAVQRWTTAATVARLAAGAPLSRLTQAVLWNVKKASKSIGGEYYLRLRRALLPPSP